jgi:hypothetical protein
VNQLLSTKPDGENGVGPTCDLAFIWLAPGALRRS